MVSGRKSREAVEDYLIAVYRLENIYGYAKTSQLAKELNVKEGTVSKVLRGLSQKGLIQVISYKGARLTESGKELAVKILRNHAILETFLREFLGFDVVKAHELAHEMEHLPQEVIEAIYEKMGRPAVCPTPDLKQPLQNVDYVPLSNSVEGRCYKVKCFINELRCVLTKFKEVGCDVSCLVKVVGKGVRGITVRLRNGREVILTLDESQAVGVEEVACDEFNNLS